MSEAATRIAEGFAEQVRHAVNALGERQAQVWRGLDRRLEEQKNLLVHLERQGRQEHRRGSVVVPGSRFVRTGAAQLLRHIGHVGQAEVIERAATAPAVTGDATWAAPLVTRTVADFFLSIRHQSAFTALLARTPPLSLGGAIRNVVVGGELQSAFVSEGAPIAVLAGSFSTLLLTPKKVATIAEFSDEMLRESVNIESIVRMMMSVGVSSALDAAFFGSGAASASTPAGALAGLTTIGPSTLTPAQEAARDDLRNLVQALDGPIDPCFVVAPSRAVWLSASIPDFGYPVFTSTAVPTDRMICIDGQALAAATSDEPRFSVSGDATLHEEDTTPLALSATGTPNVVAAPSRSLYQTNAVALRAILHVAWGLRPGGAAFLDNPAW